MSWSSAYSSNDGDNHRPGYYEYDDAGLTSQEQEKIPGYAYWVVGLIHEHGCNGVIAYNDLLDEMRVDLLRGKVIDEIMTYMQVHGMAKIIQATDGVWVEAL